GPEEGLRQNVAADDRIEIVGLGAPILVDAREKASEVRDAILLGEGAPGHRALDGRVADEESAADNEIPRAVELEQKRLAGLQELEPPRAARLPEIHFVGLSGSQELEPVAVGDAYPDLHLPLCALRPHN